MKKQVIYLGADHAGFKLKEQIKRYLLGLNFEVNDLGAYKFNKNDDYPDFGFKVAKAVSKDKNSMSILICGSSFGVCIVANKVKGIRAVSIDNIRDAKLSRQHNDANVLCLSGWNLKFNMAKRIILVWLKTKFSNDLRHKRRLAKIKNYER
ncbi:RpiB/LacA/LacB family sugar-phosphate isomerase [Candidatus Falkowbacteria bacterium]|nr:RpiB/LacA/LacB family sugar-phosphate isomerase [Candidatus Falkowbacteria bacterium]